MRRSAQPLAEHLGDTVLDIDVTANRPDCLSVIGIAREVAALTGQKIHIPEISYAETGDPIDKQISIEIADTDLCPRYCASLITGVKIGESPAWLQERLIACGQRPINNIVDITNYVMLEYGQPLHSFDYDRLKNKKIIVRRAKDGEKFLYPRHQRAPAYRRHAGYRRRRAHGSHRRRHGRPQQRGQRKHHVHPAGSRQL